MDSNWEVEKLRVFLSPQHSPLEYRFDYEFEGEKVAATLRQREAIMRKNEFDFEEEIGEVWNMIGQDSFDFTDMPDGLVENPMEDIQTELLFNPILEVERVEGVLWLRLLKFIGSDASYEERYPEWIEVKDNG